MKRCFVSSQILHHVDHDGSGPAGLHREHRGESGSAPQNHPAGSRVEKQPGQHVWICCCDESPGAATGTADERNHQQLKNLTFQSLFIHFIYYVTCCFRFHAWSRRGWHYVRDTQRAPSCTRRNSNLLWRIWTMEKVRVLTCLWWVRFKKRFSYSKASFFPRVERLVQHLLPSPHPRPFPAGAGHGSRGDTGALGKCGGGSRRCDVPPRGCSDHCTSRGDLQKQRWDQTAG